MSTYVTESACLDGGLGLRLKVLVVLQSMALTGECDLDALRLDRMRVDSTDHSHGAAYVCGCATRT